MKITIYELLGLVKDGKAPKKMKYENYEYYWYDNGIYLTTDKTRFFDGACFSDLNDTVEILEEQKKIPDKLNDINADFYVNDCYYEKLSKEEIALDLVSLQNWINYIIDYLKSKGE